MVYYFKIADEPDGTLGGFNTMMWQYEWISTVSNRKRDGIAEDWMLEYYPTIVAVDPKHKLNDVLMAEGMFVISSCLKELVEGIEPNTHQFIPITVHYGEEKHQYYILKFGNSKDCFDAKRSDVNWKQLETATTWSKKYAIPIVFIKDKMKGMHLWQNDTSQDMKLMSDDLYSLCQQNNITGLKFEKQLEAES